MQLIKSVDMAPMISGRLGSFSMSAHEGAQQLALKCWTMDWTQLWAGKGFTI